MPQKTTSVDENLSKVVDHFRSLKEQSYQSRTNNDAVPWVRPPVGDWDGDLQTKQGLIDLHAAFNTDQAEEFLKKTFTDSKPGNSSDGMVNLLQIEYAAQMERAYRARHQSMPRALAHYATREKGHGTQTGALSGASIEYFLLLIKQGTEAGSSDSDTGGILGGINPDIGGIA